MRILDLWCGDWNNKYKIYSKNNEVYGVDIEQSNVDYCKKKFPNHTFIQVNWETLPFDDTFFDEIHSMDVLEHVDDLDIVLAEATRVLKKGWKFIIEVPYRKSEQRLLAIKPEYREQVHYVRMFKDWDMRQIMSKYELNQYKEKKLKFFQNISLWYYFKNADIINQKWDMVIPKKLMRKFRFKYLWLFVIYKIFPFPFDKYFPKSIYFEFIKE